ncbi:MAG: sigma-54 dependent transcriptional regulator [Sporomusaceae bacterium]|nr:sigma-54 dependent transcriptional regulator [Sporomusaceae bacterium]
MRILLVDDDEHSRAAVHWFLKDQHHDVVECSSGEAALQRLAAEDFPLLLSDIRMQGMSGLELAASVKQRRCGWRTDVVLFTGYGDMETAIAALRLGVYDYLRKPVDAVELAGVIDRIAEHQALLRENQQWNQRYQAEVAAATAETRRELARMTRIAAASIIGNVGAFSEQSQAIFRQAQQFHTERSMPVLIQGETGTGKEIVAKMIHYGQPPAEASGPFVDINCAALAPTLFESELFGYEPGAFTGGAARGQKGKFELAEGGTLFLDEVGEIPLRLQGKLLRVLEQKDFYRLGGIKKIKTDVRIICATNLSLEKQVACGKFRRDLFFRLNIAQLLLSPLRERKEEILPLALLFLKDFTRLKGRRFNSIQPETAAMLREYSWPGNIRELRNVIDFATFAYDDVELKPVHLAGQLLHDSCGQRQPPQQPDRAIVLPLPAEGYPLKRYTEDVVEAVLQAHNGHQAATARYLGITSRALAYRIGQPRSGKDSKD